MAEYLNTGRFYDIDMARRFIELLTGDLASPVTFQTFDDSQEGRGHLARVFHGAIDEHFDALAALNRQGAGVFVMVNEGDGIVHSGRRTCRTNENVVSIRAQFVDLDGAPLAPVTASVTPPAIVVESSPERWHCFWHVADTTLEEFGPAQTALASLFNGDPSVKDLARVMRLPGFAHQKGEPFMTRIVYPTATQAPAQSDNPSGED